MGGIGVGGGGGCTPLSLTKVRPSLFDRVNRGLTLVRLVRLPIPFFFLFCFELLTSGSHSFYPRVYAN